MFKFLTNEIEKVITENGYIPKQLYAKIAKTQTVDNLQLIWNENPEWQKNKNFIQQVTKRKAELAAS